MTHSIAGYAEGYYGRLLSWAERGRILETLNTLSLNTYYYAPKEDPYHRLHWRTPYATAWLAEFRQFCKSANQRGIRVVAGVAPGLDFDFSDLPQGEDFQLLLAKAQGLLEEGADVISLLMDDIDADFETRCGDFSSEGQAHAELANALGAALSVGSSRSIWVTPRIYADELISEAPLYLQQFVSALEQQHVVLYCGSDVVARTLDANSFNRLCIPTLISKTDKTKRTGQTDNKGETADVPKHRVILWDNLYANDYCPRRLFIGPWQGRAGIADVLLNPTGMVHTDMLLLELMADGLQSIASGLDTDSQLLRWKAILEKQGVPDVFLLLAPYFNHPVFNPRDSDSDSDMSDGRGSSSDSVVPEVTDELLTAIEDCLWRWKSPLSREWYSFIFGLKHDLLAMTGNHSKLRIDKTQNSPMAILLAKRESRD